MRGKSCFLVWVTALIGGCSGEYVLTAPDVVALSGQEAPVVVRLQRREFWFYYPPMEESAITFRAGDGTMRCARTDKAGYAVVGVPAPPQAGVFEVTLHHQDNLGFAVAGSASIFVLSPDRPIVAVDLDSLPRGGGHAPQAAAALGRIRQQAQILYLTQEYADGPLAAHELLGKLGCPPGPVVPWRREAPWHARLPWKRRPPGVAAALRQRLSELRWGVTADAASAGRFDQADLKVLVVGEVGARVESAEYFASWNDLTVPPPAGAPLPAP